MISKYRACLAVFKFDPIRCAGGKDTGDTCLSDKQIAAAKVWRSPYSWGFPLKNGITTLAGWSVGGENAPGSLNPWIMLDQPPEAELSGTDINASQYIRYGVMADKDFRGDLDLKDPKVRTRIQALSNLTDQNNPDLTPFFKRGGKLIMKENTGDYAISPESNFAFYNQIVAKMGKPTVAKFLRFYVNPGVNHGGSGTRADGTPIPDKVDLLAELDKWVETGAAPGPLTVAAYKDGKATAAKPLCELPLYPRYKGAGDPDAAASYACVPH